MWQRRLVVAVTILIGASMSAWAQKDPELPAGPMQPTATTVCTECHDSRMIVQQRLSKAAWTKEVDKMTKWGATVDAKDRDALIDYLSTNFGVDKAPYQPERSAATRNHSKR